MSSRSFRRRNSRRRRQGTPGGAAPGGTGTPGSRGPTHAPGSAGFQVEKPSRPGGPPQRGPARGRHPGGRPAPAAEPPVRAAPIEIPDCAVCGRPVRDLASALTHKLSRRPAHFDCVLKELRESNEVAPQERICYLGGGNFGVLEFRPPGSPNRFVIRKRIPYEDKETPQEWKKPLLVTG